MGCGPFPAGCELTCSDWTTEFAWRRPLQLDLLKLPTASGSLFCWRLRFFYCSRSWFPRPRLIKPYLRPGHQPADRGFLCPLTADFSSVRCSHFRAGAQPAQTVCRTPAGRAGVEVPHAHGGGSAAAFIRSCHGDVLVCLRTDESLDRQMVLDAGRGGSRRYRCDGFVACQIRGTERARAKLLPIAASPEAQRAFEGHGFSSGS